MRRTQGAFAIASVDREPFHSAQRRQLLGRQKRGEVFEFHAMLRCAQEAYDATTFALNPAQNATAASELTGDIEDGSESDRVLHDLGEPFVGAFEGEALDLGAYAC